MLLILTYLPTSILSNPTVNENTFTNKSANLENYNNFFIFFLQGNYSCSVQSSVSSNGRNGPFFTLDVTPHPNYQQLRFPQNFPKAFPEAPVAGEDVRLVFPQFWRCIELN